MPALVPLEAKLDVYRTARGSGWRLQISALMRYYNLTIDDIRRMDEIQIQNRMADLKDLMKYERFNTRLAMWGEKKQSGGNDGTNPRRPGRRGRQDRG